MAGGAVRSRRRRIGGVLNPRRKKNNLFGSSPIFIEFFRLLFSYTIF
jgi:hypothetical protein